MEPCVYSAGGGAKLYVRLSQAERLSAPACFDLDRLGTRSKRAPEVPPAGLVRLGAAPARAEARGKEKGRPTALMTKL